MNRHHCLLIYLSLACCLASASAEDLPPIPPIARVLPPEGLEIPAEVRQRLETRLAATKKRLEMLQDNDLAPDVEVFTKAVELALLHREFYADKDFAKAEWALDEADKRLDSLEKGQSPWTRATGLVVRGYRSSIDHSAQPYGLVIPENHDFEKPCPLYVWLHGRGDKNTDLHFLHERANKVGQIAPPGAIVLHPFGRHCVGFKHAGEIDVLEATDKIWWGTTLLAISGAPVDESRHYKIDKGRPVLIGFSMGGAGAWHLGAHYPDRWIAVSPGAGFAETARYQNLTSDKYPPSYEQKLWGQYDVPGYVRNLFNTNVIAYSGELDRQIQAARVMEEAYQAEGRTLTHLIGPGVEHKYEPATLKELLGRIEGNVRDPSYPQPGRVTLQTRTLRYNTVRWVSVEELGEHWVDARVDAQIDDLGKSFDIKTMNVARLVLSPWLIEPERPGEEARSVANLLGWTVQIDGQSLKVRSRRAAPQPIVKGASASRVFLVKKDSTWQEDEDQSTFTRKRPGLQGPIDDAFMSSFVVVAPTGKSRNPAFQQWCDFEIAHFQQRWRGLMRGDVPLIKDTELNSDDIRQANLILWGDADSNAIIREMQQHLPVKFTGGRWTLGDKTYDGNRFVPVCIHPLSSAQGTPRYIVLNSGLTFREGHDRTNSLQNPKLPDWAIIDMTQPPDAFAPGRIHDADFFDEKWQLKRQPKAP